MAKIRLENLSFRYPGAASATLPDLSLDIAHGAAHALLGGSGTGKTTLLNLLSGLLQPSAGNIYMDDRNVSHVRGRDRGVAQVFQFPVLYAGLNVLDNLAFPLRTQGWKRRLARARAAEVAQQLNLHEVLKRSVSSLSLFEKQLVAIGRALVRPDVALVLLDEPLTAVEPSVKWRLRSILREAQATSGTTMVYVTHDQTEALTFADRVSLMRNGDIVQTGSPQQLHDEPLDEYAAYFIGSPGMNVLPASVAEGAIRVDQTVLGRSTLSAVKGYKIGFRASWAQLDDSTAQEHGFSATVANVRPTGTTCGVRQGLYELAVRQQTISVSAPLGFTVGQSVTVAPARWVVFRDSERVAVHG